MLAMPMMCSRLTFARHREFFRRFGKNDFIMFVRRRTLNNKLNLFHSFILPNIPKCPISVILLDILFFRLLKVSRVKTVQSKVNIFYSHAHPSLSLSSLLRSFAHDSLAVFTPSGCTLFSSVQFLNRLHGIAVSSSKTDAFSVQDETIGQINIHKAIVKNFRFANHHILDTSLLLSLCVPCNVYTLFDSCNEYEHAA